MSLLKTIQEMRMTFLGKSKVKYSILGVVIAEVQRKSDAKTSDNDLFVVGIIKKLIESIDESLKYSTDENKTNVLREEKEILTSFVPKQLTYDELKDIMCIAILNDPQMKEKKNMFPYLKSNFAGLYNGEDANTILTTL